MQTQTSTPSPKYWNHQGKYETELEALRQKLVPDMGKADTMHGELLRCVSKLYYDVYNNGFGNRDVLQYQVSFLMNFEEELKQFGLTEDEWYEVRMGFNHPPRNSSLYDDADFVQALDKLVDATVLFCQSK